MMQQSSVTGKHVHSISSNLCIHELDETVQRQRGQTLREALDILLGGEEFMVVRSLGLENLHDEPSDHGRRILAACKPHLHSIIGAIVDALSAKEGVASFAKTDEGHQSKRGRRRCHGRGHGR